MIVATMHLILVSLSTNNHCNTRPRALVLRLLSFSRAFVICYAFFNFGVVFSWLFFTIILSIQENIIP